MVGHLLNFQECSFVHVFQLVNLNRKALNLHTADLHMYKNCTVHFMET